MTAWITGTGERGLTSCPPRQVKLEKLFPEEKTAAFVGSGLVQQTVQIVARFAITRQPYSLGATFYPWPEPTRSQPLTLTAHWYDRREEPSMQRLQRKKMFASSGRQSETARYRMRPLNLRPWIFLAASSMPKRQLCFRWSWCLPW